MARESEEFEAAWAQIVADLTSDGPVEPSPDALADASSDQSSDQPSDEPLAHEAPVDADVADTWEDEGHFTPPPPPEIPAGSPATRLGWVGVLGGPAVLAASSLTGWNAPQMVLWGAGLATLVGFVTLVWQLPEAREDGWDDGAQV